MAIDAAESIVRKDAFMAQARSIRAGLILSSLLLAAACAPQPAVGPPGSSVIAAPANYPLFRADLARSDAIVVARLVDAVPESAGDRFVVTARWDVVEVLSGRSSAAQIVTRLPFDARGWKADGPLPPEATVLHRNRNYVLLLSRELYEKSVAARQGTPLPGVLGVSLGYYLLNGDKIQSGSAYETPPDLMTLRKLLGGQ